MRGGSREYIFYCKRAILFLSSSKILTPPSPETPGAGVDPAVFWGGGGGEGHSRRAVRGRGVDILEDERSRIALLQ